MEAFRALPVFVAVTLAMPLLVSAAERDQDSETATRPEYGLKLNAARRLDENAPSEEGDAPTYLTAFKMIGTPNEKIELIDSAEVRRGGSVLRGDTITYTTRYGTRTYAVSTVKKISNTDWSYLQSASDNRITLTTCVANDSSQRWVVQAVEKNKIIC